MTCQAEVYGMKAKNIEEVLTVMANKQGCELNGQDRLLLRTRISNVLAAKERHHQRMTAPVFQWKKPPPRR